MKKLNPNTRITEADSLTDSLVDLFAKQEGLVGDSFLTGLFDKIKIRSQNLTTAIKRTKVISALDELDTKRDEIVRALGNILTGYASLPIENKKSAAKSLLEIYDKYGRAITSENYATESSLIESMLEDFGSPAISEHVLALEGVAETLKSLREAENAFKQANSEYVQDTASSANEESAIAIKKDLVTLINEKLVPYLDTMTMASPEKYSEFAKHIEIEIGRTNETVKKRAKK